MAEQMDEVFEEEISDSGEKIPKTRWIIPSDIRRLAFVGKDGIVVASDLYVFIFNVKTCCEKILIHNARNSQCPETGDGVHCIAGSRTNIYAFSERVEKPRIFFYSYPSNKYIMDIRETDVFRCKSICLMENDLLATFGDFTDFLLSIWDWRTKVKLYKIQTGINQEEQIYCSSTSHTIVLQCWLKGFILWEIAPCYKKCKIMKRIKLDGEPKISDICFTPEGHIYAVDYYSNLYTVGVDGVNLQLLIEYDQSATGDYRPLLCAFMNGFLIYDSKGYIKYIKKEENKWTSKLACMEEMSLVKLISNSSGDIAIAWSARGHVYRYTEEADNKFDIKLVLYKQRKIKKIDALNPLWKYIVTINYDCEICLYETATGKLVDIYKVEGRSISLRSSPVEPLIAVYGEHDGKSGVCLLSCFTDSLKSESSLCLTTHTVNKIVFSMTGRNLVAACMSVGHLFIMKILDKFKLQVLKYAELGRGLASCRFIVVDNVMRFLALILFSDKYKIGERVVCFNAETGEDNKLAGKMYGPYRNMFALHKQEHIMMIPFHSTEYHIVKLTAGKGVVVNAKVVNMVQSGHEIKFLLAYVNDNYLVTFSLDGYAIINRYNKVTGEYDLVKKSLLSHRYDKGINVCTIDNDNKRILTLCFNKTVAITYTDENDPDIADEVIHEVNEGYVIEPTELELLPYDAITYLEMMRRNQIQKEAAEFRIKRGMASAQFESIQAQLVKLLEDNEKEPPLHQLPVSEFNLNTEARDKRIREAAEEREVLRITLEAEIAAMNKVSLWIKEKFWNPMVKQTKTIEAVFSHYKVDNYALIPKQAENFDEFKVVTFLRELEMENDDDLFQPWLEREELIPSLSKIKIDSRLMGASQHSIAAAASVSNIGPIDSQQADARLAAESIVVTNYMFHPSRAYKYVELPSIIIPQMILYGRFKTHFQSEITKEINSRLVTFYNKLFDDLVALKQREVALVIERNNRLRVILSELNTLSDLRGSSHYITTTVQDPEWSQFEIPERLVTVEPDEVSVTPYISPSQVVIPPPEPKPKDDFKERALMDMMDGVLEKLWHEEIKKPIPKPQCMIDKEPENWNEDDLRLVFDYESKVEFRNQEREKYRHMLHAEWTKLSGILNEGIVKFNAKVKEMFIMKLKVQSCLNEEYMYFMRMRAQNLSIYLMEEEFLKLKNAISSNEDAITKLQNEIDSINNLSKDCQSMYESYAVKDRQLDRNFKSSFSDQSPLVVDQCYRFYKRRPKWINRGTSAPALMSLSVCCGSHTEPSVQLPQECMEYLRGLENLDNISNMPALMEESVWHTVCRLRRTKIEVEMKMRALCVEAAQTEAAASAWYKRCSAYKTALAAQHQKVLDMHYEENNRTLQLVLPAGSVEITTSGHIEDFDDAQLILKEDVESINNLILKVGNWKLAMMRKQIEFRRGIIAREWEHAQLKMKIRHMKEELYSYERLKIPKELQYYLKNVEKGYTDDMDFFRMERENDAVKAAHNKRLGQISAEIDEIEMKIIALNAKSTVLDQLIFTLKLELSEKKLREDPEAEAKKTKAKLRRMNLIVKRSKLVREVQQNHTNIICLQTELELLKLKTYPTMNTIEIAQESEK